MKRILLFIFILLTISNITNAQPCWKTIATGQNSSWSLAIAENGTLWAWGNNNFGQLGDGTTISKNIPIQIGTDYKWKSIATGGSSSFAIKNDGSLWAWGGNDIGQLGDGTVISKLTPIQIGNATDWSFITGGDRHTLAIKTNGTLWGWGSNLYGEVGDGTNLNKNVPTQIGIAHNWQTVDCGLTFTMAIKNDGSLWGWGRNYMGQLGDGTYLTFNTNNVPTRIGNNTNWSKISCGGVHTLAIKTDSSLWSWGANFLYQLGDGTTTDRIYPSQVGSSSNWQSISAGFYHSNAIKSDGSLWRTGQNFGLIQLGLNNNFAKISGGSLFSLFLDSLGNLFSLGANSYGELGIGNNISQSIPTLVNCPYTPCPSPVSQLQQIRGCKEISYKGISYFKDAIAKDTIKSITGCDSVIVDVQITFIKPITTNIKLISCNNTKLQYNGISYSNSTNFIDTIKAVGGCDSIYNNVSIYIRNIKPQTQTLTANSCNGKLTWNGITYNASTILRDTLRTSEGCDSIYKITNINVTNVKPQVQNITVTGCKSVEYKKIKYTSSILVKDTLKTTGGCDSIYLNVTITITQPLTPSVVILNRGSDVNCPGATISIKAFVTNGGTLPTYQWSVNGVDISGANGVYFITNTLHNGDTIRCTIISSLPCVTSSTAISNFIIAKIVVPVYKTINLTGCNKVVYNDRAYYNSTNFNDTVRTILGCDSIINTVNIAINNITTTTFTINLSGCNSIVYNGVTYAASTTLRDTIRTAQGCDSNYIVRNLNVRNINPSTNIQNLSGCAKVIFREVNYTSSTSVRDTIRTSQGCDSVYNITNITINPAVTPTIVITASQNPVCTYTNIIFYAIITNGGTNPQYQWYKNGVLIPNATASSYALAGVPDSTIVYTCTVTSNAPCAEPLTVVSNSLRLQFGGNATASINIVANQTQICTGATVTFTASIVNGGANPQYQWKKNGVNISGATAATYTTTAIANNNVFTCVLTSNSLCVAATTVISNAVTITVNASNVTDIYTNNLNSQVIFCSPCHKLNTSTPISTTLTGGTWTVGGGTITNGMLSFYGINTGSNYIFYKIFDPISRCSTYYSKAVLVYDAPSINGDNTICSIGGSKSLTSQTYSVNSYWTWSSSNPSVATVSSTSSPTNVQKQATITGQSAGTAIISFSTSFTYTNGTYANISVCPAVVSKTIIVAPVPISPIAGLSSVCVGSNIILSNATPNGVWTSTQGRATVNFTGRVLGTSAGTANINYTVTNASTGCSAVASKSVSVFGLPNVPSISYAPVTVNPQAGAPAGSFCLNRTFDVVGSPIGGVWASNNNSVMTVTNLGTVSTVGIGNTTLTYSVSNLGGCSNSRSITGNVVACAARQSMVNGQSSMTNDLMTNDFVMYPNPAKSFISVNVETLIGRGSIIVTDLYGKTVKTQPLSMGTNTVDIATLCKGMYFVSIITSEGKTTKKLVIK